MQDQMADLCDEAYGQLLEKLDILERLHDAGLPLDVSDMSFVLPCTPLTLASKASGRTQRGRQLFL